MTSSKIRRLITIGTLIAGTVGMSARENVTYEAELILNSSTGKLAPYYIASNRHGILTQKNDALVRVSAIRPIETSRRFAYSYGLEIIGGYSHKAPYTRFDNDNLTWEINRQSPAPVWIQQLFGEVRYRSLFLNAGMKQRESAIVNFSLSSGDVIESGNSRPVPQVRAGLTDFRDIPFTGGWLQIQGEISYGKFMQNKYLQNHFNYYIGHINIGSYFHYKRCYFRTNPSQPFSATFGGQFTCQFGGTTTYYYEGEIQYIQHNRSNLKAFWHALIPKDTGIEGFYEGQHIGSWDIAFRYRFSNGTRLKAYVMNLWEDGSGMGKMNGWDGLWGLEYKSPRKGWLEGAVVEYIDFTNQSGPIHWDPADNPGTTLDGVQTTGEDKYYNNGFYNSYANYGMSMGTPFIKSPIYNLNGKLIFMDNVVRGFHIGFSGSPADNIQYRVLGGYRKSWGIYATPRMHPAGDTSLMAEIAWRPRDLKGLSVKGQIAFDNGDLYGRNLGACLTLTYSGLFKFIK